jgi:hypothetical protein
MSHHGSAGVAKAQFENFNVLLVVHLGAFLSGQQ